MADQGELLVQSPKGGRARLVLKAGRFEDDQQGRACEQGRSLGFYPKLLESPKQENDLSE